MPGSSRKVPAWLPILVILIAMISIQSGASLAKSLFPLVGAPGVTALRLALGTFILVVIFKPWRLRFAPEQRLPLLFYGLSLGAMNYLFYLSIQRIPLGVAVALEFTGPLAVALFGSRRPLDFLWVALAVLGLWFLLPLGQSVAQIDPVGALLALRRWRLLGGLHSDRPARRRRAWPRNGRYGVADRCGGLRPDGDDPGQRYALSVGAAAAGTGDRHFIDRAALLSGNGCLDPHAQQDLWHPDEHGAGSRRAFRDGVSWRNVNRDPNAGAGGDYSCLDGLHADNASGNEDTEGRHQLAKRS